MDDWVAGAQAQIDPRVREAFRSGPLRRGAVVTLAERVDNRWEPAYWRVWFADGQAAEVDERALVPLVTAVNDPACYRRTLF